MTESSGLFRYVAVGDSTGVGVGAESGGGYVERLFQRLRAAGVAVGLLNLCQSGATSRDVISQVQRAVQKTPHLITLGVGANDVWRMVPPTTFEQHLKACASALSRSGAMVVFTNIVDVSLAPVAKMAETFLNVPLSTL